jgi:nucleoid DNA-binding protein
MPSTSRAQLCRVAADAAGISVPAVEKAVKAFVLALEAALVAGERVELRGLGSFRSFEWVGRRVAPARGPNQRARPGRPRVVPDSRAIRFRPGSHLRGLRPEEAAQ